MSDQANHTALLPADAPAWAGVLVDLFTYRIDHLSHQLDQTLVEVASLQSLLTHNRIHRDEAARIAGVSMKTIDRWAKGGRIANYAGEGKRPLYEFSEIVRAKRKFK